MRTSTEDQAAQAAIEELQLLTVAEAAHSLRIGRSLAYELARTYIATDGLEGLPVLKLGARMRVPLWALEELARTGRVVRLADGPPPAGLRGRRPRDANVDRREASVVDRDSAIDTSDSPAPDAPPCLAPAQLSLLPDC
jgi:hypothetical protein